MIEDRINLLEAVIATHALVTAQHANQLANHQPPPPVMEESKETNTDTGTKQEATSSFNVNVECPLSDPRPQEPT